MSQSVGSNPYTVITFGERATTAEPQVALYQAIPPAFARKTGRPSRTWINS